MKRRTGHKRVFPVEIREGCSELDNGRKEGNLYGCSTVYEAKEVRKSAGIEHRLAHNGSFIGFREILNLRS